MTRPGFYPRGSGQVIAHIQPCSQVQAWIDAVEMPANNEGNGLQCRRGCAGSCGQASARRAGDRLEAIRNRALILSSKRGIMAPGSVIGIMLEEPPVATFFFGLGARGKPAEKVADEAVEQVIVYAEADARRLMGEQRADQVLLPLVLSDHSSEFRVQAITRHLTTNIAVIRMFIDREIVCEGEEGSPGVVRIEHKL